MDFKCYTSFMRKQKEQKKRRKRGNKTKGIKKKKYENNTKKMAFIDWLDKGKNIKLKNTSTVFM